MLLRQIPMALGSSLLGGPDTIKKIPVHLFRFVSTR
jgi:hypothetical protein